MPFVTFNRSQILHILHCRDEGGRFVLGALSGVVCQSPGRGHDGAGWVKLKL